MTDQTPRWTAPLDNPSELSCYITIEDGFECCHGHVYRHFLGSGGWAASPPTGSTEVFDLRDEAVRLIEQRFDAAFG